MNTKDFLRLGVPLGEAQRRAVDFISKFILGGGPLKFSKQEFDMSDTNPKPRDG